MIRKNIIVMSWNPSNRLWEAKKNGRVLHRHPDAGTLESILNASALAWVTITPGTRNKLLSVPLCQETRLN